MKNSFSSSVKDALAELEIKKECCKISLLYGMLRTSKSRDSNGITLAFDTENTLAMCERVICETLGFDYDIEYHGSGYYLVISDPFVLGGIIERFGNLSWLNKKVFKCEGCIPHFLRGAFISCGSVNSPSSEYHLELHSKYPINELIPPFSVPGITPLYSKRGNSNILYLKNGEEISDFLQYIGARNASFALINEKIRREIRSNANRQKNFDTANIQKTIKANEEQVETARFLIEGNHLGQLNKSLAQTVVLRYENPALSLSELALMHNPPITKSGLTNRLKKIRETANKIRESKN
ncbi:MAG: DNA-binding protein WhiA [Clostridia bacterium]|nr:DNA-binding protein WhiA [Clostridia bacterium]